MSGDPNTSLGNGFTNLMLTAFMADKKQLNFEGMVEGDDGIFAFDGQPDFSLCASMGFELKFEAHKSIYTTSFCGLLLSQSLAAFASPAYVLASFAWTHSPLRFGNRSIQLGLLRCKAYSLKYCNPRCPILTVLADKYLELTKGVKMIKPKSYWEALIVEEATRFSTSLADEAAKGISMQDRLDFEHLFGVSVDTQIAIEEYIKTKRDFSPLKCGEIDSLYPDMSVFRAFDAKFCGPKDVVEGNW
jgi:hypothetical protein